MNNWTIQRKASFFVHAYFVAVPFGLSTGAALAFWHDMFGHWGLAALMVVTVEVLALTGLVLFVVGIPSPFVGLRHLLPFISIVPLGRELYILLAHNGWVVASALTILATSILVIISWQCFRTIERLFIDPIEAVKEKAREQVGAFTRTLAQLHEMNTIVDAFAVDRMRYHAPTITQAAYPAPQEAALVRSETTRAVTYECPNCGTQLTLGAYGSAKRYGHCNQCKEQAE